jgi:decaprenylphospho-beta-D-erythro-pentofuranosid-2-ulose 2-reductase
MEEHKRENGPNEFLAVKSITEARVMLNGLKQFQNVMVIGGKSEIGLEIIRNISLVSGGKVFLLGRKIETRDISLSGAEVIGINYDIGDPTQRIELVSKLLAERDFDLVILAAGFLGDQPIASTPAQDREIVNVNFSYSAEVLECVAHCLRMQTHGKVLVLSSVASVRPRRSNYVYGASKAGLDFLARGLQLDLEGTGVEIYIARPGFVHSRKTKGMAPAPFAISAAKAGELCAKGITKSEKVFYVPGILKYVMLVVKFLPIKILNKLN